MPFWLQTPGFDITDGEQGGEQSLESVWEGEEVWGRSRKVHDGNRTRLQRQPKNHSQQIQWDAPTRPLGLVLLVKGKTSFLMKKYACVYSNSLSCPCSPVSELKYVEQAEGLTRNLTLLRKRMSKLSRQLKLLREKAQKQIEDMYREEVRNVYSLRSTFVLNYWPAS